MQIAPRRRWLPTLIVAMGAAGIEALAAVHGHGLELLWLPAVLVGASWPTGHGSGLRNCLRRMQRR
jgi:hypothetical protein